MKFSEQHKQMMEEFKNHDVTISDYVAEQLKEIRSFLNNQDNFKKYDGIKVGTWLGALNNLLSKMNK